MKNGTVQKLLVRLLALVLAAALCPLTAVADAAYSSYVQVIYASPEGTFAAQQVGVSPANNVVSPDPSVVPAGYEAVQATPVRLIFNAAGQPIPSLVYFTYQRSVVTHPIKVNYATVNGVFASTYVAVTPAANVINPDPAMVPEGYLPLSPNPAVILFDQNGKPYQTEVTFFYYLKPNVNTGYVGGATAAPTNPPATAAPSNLTANDIITSWNLPGQIVTFGSYEQDGNTNNGKEPVEWYVLRAQTGRALLLSRYALNTQTFHTEWKEVSWKDCSLRTWLNANFYNGCFTKKEQNAIITSRLVTQYTNTSVETQDKVFLLDANEGKHMSKDLLLCKPTKYAKSKSVATENGYCYWWLRDTTNRKSDANRVYPSGDVFEYGGNTNATGIGVRPAIWVDVLAAFGK